MQSRAHPGPFGLQYFVFLAESSYLLMNAHRVDEYALSSAVSVYYHPCKTLSDKVFVLEILLNLLVLISRSSAPELDLVIHQLPRPSPN